MAASNAERLAAYSFQELHTAAQYKREDSFNALATVADVPEEDVEEEKDEALRLAQAPVDFNTNTCGLGEAQISPENFVDFADIYHSNEEYFRKLEELKTAHIETMAKLERMYQNKLRLKEVQPLIIQENTCTASSRSLSENNYQPVSLVTSLSELDICRSPSLVMSSSEDELPNFKTEYPQKRVVINYAKELISNMWRNFSVEDYIHCKGADFPVSEKKKKKPKAWVPKITVPEPFQMTIREEKRKEQNMKSKSDLETLHNMLQKQEDLECKKKFRANPVPSFIFFPPYKDIIKQNEERRRYLKDKNKEALLASLKPFKFVVREEQKQVIREKQLRDFLKCKKKTYQFKAKPVPQSTYGSSANDLLKEEFPWNSNLGSQDKLHNSFPIPSKLVLKSVTPRKPKNTAKVDKLNKHKIKYKITTFENSPERDHKYPKHLKDCQSCPYAAALLTTSKKEKKLTHFEAGEQNSKDVCDLSQSLRYKSPVRSANAKLVPCNYNSPMPTVSSRGREQATRKSGKERMREYRRELEEREERLKNRPLLFERVSQENVRMAAERHYSNTLKALGISDEFVSKKGQSGRVFEHASNQKMRSSSGDEESFNEEEKIEERENGETSYLIDINSQEACEEEDEAHEESEEEKSLEE